MKIVIAGDFAPRDRVSKLIEQNLFENIVGKVIPIINESDYAIVNLECPIISGIEKKIIKQGQAFGTNEKTINLLKHSGFDCVTLANNHFRDYGSPGCIYTLNALCSSGLDIVGGGN